MSRPASEWEEDQVIEVREAGDADAGDGWRPTDIDDGWGDHASDVGAKRSDEANRREDVVATDSTTDAAKDDAEEIIGDDTPRRVEDDRPESVDTSRPEVRENADRSMPELEVRHDAESDDRFVGEVSERTSVPNVDGPDVSIEAARQAVDEAIEDRPADREALPVAEFSEENREQAVQAARDAVHDAHENPASDRWPDRGPEFVEAGYARSDADDALGFASDHANQHLEVVTDDGRIAHLKPALGEHPDAAGRGDVTPPGTGWKREVAACDADRLMGLGVVPETVAVDDPESGRASLQDDAPGFARPLSQYEAEDVDRMAVLDYVVGNTDRHGANFRTQGDGRPAAIDNGYAFPTSPEVPIKSDFVVQRLDTPLSDEVVASVQACDPADLQAMLRRDGIEESAIAGCITRLHEVQDNGMITGDAWSGGIVTSRNTVVRAAGGGADGAD